MTNTSPSQIPKLVSDYFSAQVTGWDANDRKSHPLIHEVFIPGKGWQRYGFNKRVSISWLRKLRDQDVTIVSLRAPGYSTRIVDFGIREICRAEGGSGSWPCGICA